MIPVINGWHKHNYSMGYQAQFDVPEARIDSAKEVGTIPIWPVHGGQFPVRYII